MNSTSEPSENRKPRLVVVVASVRQERKGAAVGEWFLRRSEEHGAFDVAPVDLKELALPLMDEPNHPRLRKYVHRHTWEWSERVDAADAFVFVTPEYNHAAPSSLKNAIDYLNREWANKPVGFVSYGGVSGGTRSVQSLRPTLAVLKMVPMPEGVIIPFVAKALDAQGAFSPTGIQEEAATQMLDALLRWTRTLRPLREGVGAD